MLRSLDWMVSISVVAALWHGPLVAAAQPAPVEAEAVQSTSTPPESLAPIPAEAQRLFLDGVELARQERWGDAADAFEQSRAIHDRPSSAFNHGSALYRLRRLVQARDAFEAYRRMADANDPSQPEALRMLGVLQNAIPALTLELAPADATVTVDGNKRNETGPVRVLLLDPGSHQLVVSARKYRNREVPVELTEGERQSRVLRLELIPLPAPPKPVVVTRYEERDEGGSVLASPWFWLVTAVVIGGGVTAGILLTQEDDVRGVDKGTTGIQLTSLSLE